MNIPKKVLGPVLLLVSIFLFITRRDILIEFVQGTKNVPLELLLAPTAFFVTGMYVLSKAKAEKK